MADIKLVIHGVGKKTDSNDGNLTLAIGQNTTLGSCSIGVSFTDNGTEETNYFAFSFNSFHFLKKMYSPNVIKADFLVGPGLTGTGDEGNYKQIDKDTLETLFTNKKVSLICTKKVNNADVNQTICSGYYVYKVIPRYKKSVMYVTMEIYSPDKVMTLADYTRSFVSKKLGAEILASQMGNFPLPYKTDSSVDFDYKGLVNLIKKEKNDKGVVSITAEHIFPYLVQYNESFYNFLVRTTNRWGEFLYYEDDKLHFGYQTDDLFKESATPVSLDDTNYNLITFHDLSGSLTEQSNAGSYTPEAPYDSHVLKSMVTEDTYDKVRNTMVNIGSKKDGGLNYMLAKVGSLLTNDKPLAEWIINTAVDDSFDVARSYLRVERKNGRIKDDYFKEPKKYIPTGDEHYGTNAEDAAQYNEFSEHKPFVNDDTYAAVLKGEAKAAKNVINIDFDTTYPDLKLGDIIKVQNKEYIVVEVEGYQKDYMKVVDGNVVSTIDQDLHFRLVATAKDESKFYPMPIPQGHVRKSGPQVAVVVDNDDPNNNNRVRVMYPWQLGPIVASVNEELDDDEKIANYEGLEGVGKYLKEQDVSEATPWLPNSSTTGTKSGGVQCRHVLGEMVFIDYAYGNIERPYVVGSVVKDMPRGLKTATAGLIAPNGESIKVNEGAWKGASQFILNLLPATKFINGFWPIPLKVDTDESPAFEGGVDMGDKYGIWSIKGSTHERKVAIKSPWGDVSIDAFTGISLSAPNGNIKISGKNVTISAGNNLTLTSGANIKNRFLLNSKLNYGLGILEDIGIAVTKKLAALGLMVCDLSLLRAVVELFFRPIEGALTVKSGRFLKLEAGAGKTSYPDVAYHDRRKRIEAAKKSAMTAAGDALLFSGLFDQVTKLIGQVGIFSDGHVNMIVRRYRQFLRSKTTLQKEINVLKELSEDPTKLPCKDIEAVAKLFWDSMDTELVLSEADLGFTDDVKTDAETVKIEGVVFSKNVPDQKAKVATRLDQRATARESVLRAANRMGEKLSSVFQATNLTDEQATKELELSSYGFAAGLVTKILAGFKDEFQKVVKEQLGAKFEGINMGKKVGVDKLKRYTRRRAAIAVLDALGYKDDAMRDKVEGALPPKPTEMLDILNSNKWGLYVRSIQKMPVLKKDMNKFEKLAVDSVSKAVSSLKPWTSIQEYFSWGDPSKGDILFSSGANTFRLGANIQKQPKGVVGSGVLNESEIERVNVVLVNLRLELLKF